MCLPSSHVVKARYVIYLKWGRGSDAAAAAERGGADASAAESGDGGVLMPEVDVEQIVTNSMSIVKRFQLMALFSSLFWA